MRVVLHKILVREKMLRERSWSLALGSLAAYLQKHEPGIEVIMPRRADEILAAKPDVIGLSSVTEMWPATVALARKLRRRFAGRIVFGGPHISALPRCLPPEADAGVVGEGEATLLDLARRWGDGGEVHDPPVPGAVFRDADGEPMLGPERPLLDMNDLPLPDQTGREIVAISTVRGCPFHCTHCSQCGMFPRVRQLSAQTLVDTLLWYHERQGATKFEFLDDLFIAFPRRLQEFRELLRARGLLGRFEFYRVSLCAHLCNDEVMATLREIGVADCGIGIESAHPRVLQLFKRGVVTVEHLENAIRLAQKHQLKLGGSIVVGYPSETEDELQTTVDFVQRARQQWGFGLWSAYLCQPLPGSDLWRRGVERGELSADMDFSALRIDGDMEHFRRPWYYGNEEALPRERFVEVLRREGLAWPGRFLPIRRRRRIRLLARRLLSPLLRRRDQSGRE